MTNEPVRHTASSPWPWLLLGAAATITGHLRWGIDLLAWLAPIAWLHGVRLIAARSTVFMGPASPLSDPPPTRGTVRARRRGLLAFVALGCLTWTLTILPITTEPVPSVLALGFGVPIALALLWPYLAWAWLLRRGSASPLAFAAMLAVAEWSLYTLTPFGVWGIMANATLDDLPLMQVAALAGPTAIGFVVHGLAAALEQRWSEGQRATHSLALAAGLFVLAHVYGGARVALLEQADDELVLVAAIGTDSDVSGWPLPARERIEAWNAALVDRTRRAARSGAKLVVWTEAATVVEPADEAAWIDRIAALARAEQVVIVASYIVPLDQQPPLYENVYVLLRPDGQLEQRYLKHHLVPGEPAVAGESPAPVWVSDTLGRVSGAICYDYDFPSLVRAHARAEVDLVALPSSDWRGIAPMHTEMARLRAIEGGHSILRSTRWGLAAGIDSSGRIRGQLSGLLGASASEDRILLVHLPRHGRWTLYGWAGEWLVLVCAGFVGWRTVRVAAPLARTARALRRAS